LNKKINYQLDKKISYQLQALVIVSEEELDSIILEMESMISITQYVNKQQEREIHIILYHVIKNNLKNYLDSILDKFNIVIEKDISLLIIKESIITPNKDI